MGGNRKGGPYLTGGGGGVSLDQNPAEYLHAHWHNSKYIPVCTISRSSAYLTTYHMTKEVIVTDPASPNKDIQC